MRHGSLLDSTLAARTYARDGRRVNDADNLTINNTTYDFELSSQPQPGDRPTKKSQCKHGGWRNFTNPKLKNQGQCVSFVNHHDGKGKDDDHAGKKDKSHNDQGKHEDHKGKKK